MKRNRHGSSSEDSDDEGQSWSLHSKSAFRGNWPRPEGRKPSEVFRTDLITAMKLPDSVQLGQEEYCVLADPWRQEWERGVQVPVSPQSIPRPHVRTLAERGKVVTFTRPKKLIRMPGSEAPVLGYVDICTLADSMCRYNLCEADVAWLEFVNEEFRQMGMKELDEITMERVLEEFEHRCYDNMTHAMETEEGLGIEYDEDVVCDVCQSPHAEDGNEMVFCDKCNICVHQACYGILKVPEGSWLCRICALGILPKCLLCPKKGGAMKPTRSATKWVHVSCALWIPEVSIGSPEKMEPIMNVSRIPCNRWALICCLCKEKTGACIQCSAKNCRTAFHVTCALDRHLEMNTILTEEDEVKFKSFCPEHSRRSEGKGEENRDASQDESPPHTAAVPASDLQEAPEISQRKQKLQQLNDEFYTLVSAAEVSRDLQLPEETVDFLFQYWKLKRRANFNRPLLTPRKDEEDDLAKRERDVLLRRLKLFTHLRQDLERVRNLTYMVTRREKIKRSMCRVHQQLFHHHVRLLEGRHSPGVSSSVRLEDILFFGHGSSPKSKRKHCLGGGASQQQEWRRAGDPNDQQKAPRNASAAELVPPTSHRPEGLRKMLTGPKCVSHQEVVSRTEAGSKIGVGRRLEVRQKLEGGSKLEAGPKMRVGLRVEAGPRIDAMIKSGAEHRIEAGPKKEAGLLMEAVPKEEAGPKKEARLRTDARPKKEAGLRIEAVPKKEVGLRIEAGPKEEAGPKKEAGLWMEAVPKEEAGLKEEAGPKKEARLRTEGRPKKEVGLRIEAVHKEEAGPKKEAGLRIEAGPKKEARLRIEAGPKKEAGLWIEAGPKKEAGLRIEAGPKKEAGLKIEVVPKEDAGLQIEAGPKKSEGSECLRRRGSAKGEERRDGLRERAPPKTRPRPVSLSESSADKPVEKRIVPAAGPHLSPKAGAQLCLGDGAPNLRVTLERLPKCNGSLVGLVGGSSQNVSAAPPPAQPPQPSRPAPSAHAKNWGSFRIPKKSERLLRAHLPAPSETPPSSSPYSPGHTHHTRTHRTESHGQGSAPQADCAERDVKGRRCPAHSSHSPAHITRRYGADFLRPGILAS